MSKVSMPRPRYIAFRIDGLNPLTRRAVSNALRLATKAAAWPDDRPPALTRYEWPHGILRVEHTELGAARKLLAGLVNVDADVVRIETLSTSGTLKALTERVGVLAKRTD